jgi:hypothetical protein
MKPNCCGAPTGALAEQVLCRFRSRGTRRAIVQRFPLSALACFAAFEPIPKREPAAPTASLASSKATKPNPAPR